MNLDSREHGSVAGVPERTRRPEGGRGRKGFDDARWDRRRRSRPRLPTRWERTERACTPNAYVREYRSAACNGHYCLLRCIRRRSSSGWTSCPDPTHPLDPTDRASTRPPPPPGTDRPHPFVTLRSVGTLRRFGRRFDPRRRRNRRSRPDRPPGGPGDRPRRYGASRSGRRRAVGRARTPGGAIPSRPVVAPMSVPRLGFPPPGRTVDPSRRACRRGAPPRRRGRSNRRDRPRVARVRTGCTHRYSRSTRTRGSSSRTGGSRGKVGPPPV